jgi:hypothetical protein
VVAANGVTNDIHVTGNGTTGGTLEVQGSVANVTIGDHATLRYGDTIGTVNVGNATLAGGAIIEFKIWDTAQVAGVGYDFFSFNGLDVAGISPSNKATIKILSLSDGVHAGPVANMDFSWATSRIQKFNLGVVGAGGLHLGVSTNINDYVGLDLSGFQYTNGAPVDAGLWSLDYNVANGSITLTAVPEPSTYGLGIAALALAAVAIRRRRKTPAAKA